MVAYDTFMVYGPLLLTGQILTTAQPLAVIQFEAPAELRWGHYNLTVPVSSSSSTGASVTVSVNDSSTGLAMDSSSTGLQDVNSVVQTMADGSLHLPFLVDAQSATTFPQTLGVLLQHHIRSLLSMSGAMPERRISGVTSRHKRDTATTSV